MSFLSIVYHKNTAPGKKYIIHSSVKEKELYLFEFGKEYKAFHFVRLGIILFAPITKTSLGVVETHRILINDKYVKAIRI